MLLVIFSEMLIDDLGPAWGLLMKFFGLCENAQLTTK
jgi:hypothetical protein